MKRHWVRAVQIALFLLLFVAHGYVGRFLFRNERSRRRYLSRNLNRYNRVLLKLLKIRVKLEGAERLQAKGKRCLVVANHLGYTDVVILASQFPAVFVTSVEVEQTPALGQICKAGGCVFVERRNRNRLAEELEELSSVLVHDDAHLVVFPEATSTNGEGVLPFKNALFDSALRSGSPVLPVCLRYTHADGRPVDRTLRDSIFYYGDMAFLDHFLRLLKLQNVDVTLTVLDPIPISAETSRKELAERSHGGIVAVYGAPFGALVQA